MLILVLVWLVNEEKPLVKFFVNVKFRVRLCNELMAARF